MVRWLTCAKWLGLSGLAIFILAFVRNSLVQYNAELVNKYHSPTSVWKDNQIPEIKKIISLKNASINLDEFYTRNLLNHPGETNLASRLITQNTNLLDETKRVILHLFRNLFSNYTHAMLFDLVFHENKGDDAIGMAEIELLKYLNIKIVFKCSTDHCTSTPLAQAQAIAQRYSASELVLFCHGGGNMGLWGVHDSMRMKLILMFPNHTMAIFPQSTWYKTEKEIEDARKIYNTHRDLIIFLRDLESYKFAREHFSRSRTILSPDIAMYMDPVARFMPPIYDLIWLRRNDLESTKYTLPTFPSNLSYVVSDWADFITPRGSNLTENIVLRTTIGYTFLLRGRVFITDRLHGHILGILLGIPHVIIDNKIQKITRYRDTWTKSLDNILIASDPSDALQKAMYLLSISSDPSPLEMRH